MTKNVIVVCLDDDLISTAFAWSFSSIVCGFYTNDVVYFLSHHTAQAMEPHNRSVKAGVMAGVGYCPAFEGANGKERFNHPWVRYSPLMEKTTWQTNNYGSFTASFN